MGGWEGTYRFGELQNNLASERTRAAARQAGDCSRWTRNRAMPLADMFRCTLSKKGLTAVMELRQYFQAAGRMGQGVSKQDYLKQRRKLNPEAFRGLNRKYLQQFYAGKEARKRRGYAVLAADGSGVEIPDSEENRQEYGESKNKYGKAVARANLNAAYDARNRFIAGTGYTGTRAAG